MKTKKCHRDVEKRLQKDVLRENYQQRKSELRQMGGNLEDLRRDHEALKLETAIIDGEVTLVRW